jgi:thermitase
MARERSVDFLIPLLFLGCAVFLTFVSPVKADESEALAVPGECIITVAQTGLASAGVLRSDRLAEPNQFVVRRPIRRFDAAQLSAASALPESFLVTVPADASSNLQPARNTPLEQCRQLIGGDVVASQPNYLYTAQGKPNDPLLTNNLLDGLEQTGAFEAWDITTGSPSILVAVLDSGVSTHPEIKHNLLPGFDFINDDSDASDDFGHGTHIAGIIGARGNNRAGFAGIAWNTKILPVKVLNAAGSGTTAVITEGINYAVAQGARVLNLSLGGTTQDNLLHTAIQNAVAAGSLPVAATGNTGQFKRLFPAAYPEVLAVGSFGKWGRYSEFSNYGGWVDLTAPGDSIESLSLNKGQASILTGTSFAAPFVAGAAALLLAQDSSLSPSQLRARLLSSARGTFYNDPITALHRPNDQLGVGSLAIEQALNSVAERTLVVRAHFREVADAADANELFLTREKFYNLSIELENVTTTPKSVQVEVFGATDDIELLGGAAQSQTLAVGVPQNITGYSMRLGPSAQPGEEFDIIVRVTPSGEAAQDFRIKVVADLNALPGWPQTIPECLPGQLAENPAVVTMVDGLPRVYQPDLSFDRLYSYKPDGTTALTPYQGPPVQYWPSFGRLSGDSAGNIVLPAYTFRVGEADSTTALIYALSATNNQLLPGWPVQFRSVAEGKRDFDLETNSVLTVGDINADGVDEVVVAETRFAKSAFPESSSGRYQTRVYVLNAAGALAPGWPQLVDGQISPGTSPAIGDTTGDGVPEIVIAIQSSSITTSRSNQTQPMAPVVVFSNDGRMLQKLLPYGPTTPYCGEASENVALADLDLNGADEIVRYYVGCGLQVWRGDGTQLPGFPSFGGVTTNDVPKNTRPVTRGGRPSIADLDADGRLDIVALVPSFRATGKSFLSPVEFVGTLVAVSSDGRALPGFPIELERRSYSWIESAPQRGGEVLIADVDGDSKRELFVETRVSGALHGFTSTGANLPGFPFQLRQTGIGNNPFSIADVNLDGSFDLVFGKPRGTSFGVFSLPFRYADSGVDVAPPEYAPWSRPAANVGRTGRASDVATSYTPGTIVKKPTLKPPSKAAAQLRNGSLSAEWAKYPNGNIYTVEVESTRGRTVITATRSLKILLDASKLQRQRVRGRVRRMRYKVTTNSDIVSPWSQWSTVR